MQTYTLEQGTQEWHDLRAKYHRTASRTPVVVGVSPFSNKEKLADEIKFGKKPFYNQAMRDGNELEGYVRGLTNNYFNDTFEPLVATKDNYLASLDGIDLDMSTIIEIKVSESTYNDIKNGIIPEHYLYQIQHQLMVTGAKIAYLIAYSKELDEIIVSDPIHPDIKLHKKIVKAWDRFDKFMESYEGMAEITDERAVNLSNEYLELQRQKKLLEEREKLLKENLLTFVKEDKTAIGGITISKTKGRETIDYKTFIKDNNLSIDDKYKKIGADSYTFRVAS